LLRGETGLGIDFTDSSGVGSVAVIGHSTNYSNVPVDGFLTQSGTSPKLVRNASGTYVWSPHNLALYSEDLTNWTNVNTSDSAAVLTASAGNAVHSITRVPSTLIAGATYYARVKLTAGTHGFAYLNVRGDASEDHVTAVINLTSGAITETDVGTTSGTIVSSSSVADGSGWYVVLVFSVVATSAPVFCVGIPAGAAGNTFTATGETTWNAAGTETISVQYAQLNRGTTPTTYLATTSAAKFAVPMDYDSGWAMLVEPAATNLILNNATMSTQNVTTSAVAYTLSFFGTGTITLSGTSTAGPLVGTGAANRVSLTFTPSAGTLTLTVSGSVTMAQIETGSVATSPVPTFAAPVTRAADNINVATSALPYSATAGTVLINAVPYQVAIDKYLVSISDGTTNERIQLYDFAPAAKAWMSDGGAVQVNALVAGSNGNAVAGALFKVGLAWSANDVALVKDAGTAGTDASATLPTPTIMYIGNRYDGAGGNEMWNGRISSLIYLPRRMTNADLVTRTT
jgi:hypothetical protein